MGSRQSSLMGSQVIRESSISVVACVLIVALGPIQFGFTLGDHHTKEDFVVSGKEPKDEVQIFTWKDTTLRELTNLVKEVAPEARRKDAKLSFAYPDKNGRFVVREIGDYLDR